MESISTTKEATVPSVTGSGEISGKCGALTSKGLKCKNSHLEGELYCHIHSKASEKKKCEGFTRDNKPCENFPMKGSKFCRPDHDPAYRTSSTKDFRRGNLRNSLEYTVRRATENKDVYSGTPLARDLSDKHLEHFLELNVARDVYDIVSKDADTKESEVLKNNLKDSFNQVFNLGFTGEVFNQGKKNAVVEFCQDLRFREVNQDGLAHYLRKNFTDVTTRSSVRKIEERIVKSYDEMVEYANKFQGGSPLHDESMDCLGYVFEKMKIQK